MARCVLAGLLVAALAVGSQGLLELPDTSGIENQVTAKLGVDGFFSLWLVFNDGEEVRVTAGKTIGELNRNNPNAELDEEPHGDVREFDQSPDHNIEESTLSHYVTTGNKWSMWASKIEVRVKKAIKDEKNECGSLINVYYAPDLAAYLLQMTNLISMWSCVVHQTFGFDCKQSSSAAVESDFNDIKHRLCNDVRLPIRVDEFVEKHITYLSGRNYLIGISEEARTEQQQTVNEPTTIEDKTSTGKKIDGAKDVNEEQNIGCPVCARKDYPSGAHSCTICQKFVHVIEPCSYPIDGEDEGYGEKRVCFECRNLSAGTAEHIIKSCIVEDWRGQVSQYKKNKQSYYLKKKHTQSSFENKSTKEFSILKNGHQVELGFIKINGKDYSLSNTCPFDCLFQIFLIAWMDYPEMKDFMDLETEFVELFGMIKKTDSDKKITAATYKSRCQFLLKYFDACKSTVYNNTYVVQTQFSIADLIPKFFQHIPSSKELYTCSCGNEETFDIYYIKIFRHQIRNNEKTGSNLSDQVSSYIKSNGPDTKACGKEDCTKIFEKRVIPGRIIFIETFDFEEGNNTSVRIKDIPHTMNLQLDNNSLDYTFIGGVEVRSTISRRANTDRFDNGVGHYMAISRRCDGSFVKIDDQDKSEKLKPTYKFIPEILLYFNFVEKPL